MSEAVTVGRKARRISWRNVAPQARGGRMEGEIRGSATGGSEVSLHKPPLEMCTSVMKVETRATSVQEAIRRS